MDAMNIDFIDGAIVIVYLILVTCVGAWFVAEGGCVLSPSGY